MSEVAGEHGDGKLVEAFRGLLSSEHFGDEHMDQIMLNWAVRLRIGVPPQSMALGEVDLVKLSAAKYLENLADKKPVHSQVSGEIMRATLLSVVGQELGLTLGESAEEYRSKMLAIEGNRLGFR